MNRRVLIIGYWFVDAIMGGVRLRRIARLLPQHGWDPVVLTHPRDPASGVPLPPGVPLEEVAAPDLTRAYTRLRGLVQTPPENDDATRKEPATKNVRVPSHINRWVMVPDKEVTWYRAACIRGTELLRARRFDAIFASLPPRTTLLVAARLSRDTGVPCVLEFRDLWTGNPYHHVAQPTGFHRWLHRYFERRALGQARRITALSKGIADYLSGHYSKTLRAPVELNYNFFDPAEYPPPESASSVRRPFTISYVGALYDSRTPHQFFEGLHAFLDQQHLSPEQVRFRWAGPISGVNDLAAVIDRTGIRPHLDFEGQVPHRQAMQLLIQSDVALVLQSPHDPIHVPGKLFEAMGARVPVLTLANPCEVTEIIERCHAGLVSPHDKASIAARLADFYRLWTQGQKWEFNEPEVERFSADASVRRLAQLFDQVVA